MTTPTTGALMRMPGNIPSGVNRVARPEDLPEGPLTSIDFLKAHGKTIATLIGRETGASDMSVKVFKSTDSKIVFRAEIGGKSGFVKYFQHSDPTSQTTFKREFTTLRLLLHSNLSPRIIHIHPSGQFILSHEVDGQLLSDTDVLTPTNLPVIAEKLGRWAGSVTNVMPNVAVDDTWFDYFQRCPELRQHPVLDVHGKFLKAFKIRTKSLTQNDPALSNFVLGPNDEIVGLDYENSQMKPMGWDVLQIGRVLTRRFPDQIDAIAKSLAVGFAGETAVTDRAIEALIKIFVAASAFKDPSGISLGQDLLDNYNSRADADTNYVVTTPYHSSKNHVLTEQSSEQLLDHICMVVEGNFHDNPVDEDVSDTEPSTISESYDDSDDIPEYPEVHGLLAAACANCKGWCCKDGATNNANIDDSAIDRVRERHPDWTPEQIVGFYSQHLPLKHTKESCLFQSPAGCMLPRYARSEICNTYQCNALAQLADNLELLEEESLLCVATEDGAPKQAVLIDGDARAKVDLNQIAPTTLIKQGKGF